MGVRFGAFGKIPVLADFLTLNLSPSFIRPWDSWLQASILELKGDLGDGVWNDRYLSAPIWRFTLPRGVAGKKAVSGVFMPSIDKVGRQYPLTLACQHFSENTAKTHFSNNLVFEQLEEIALNALYDWTPEMLVSSLTSVEIVKVSSALNTSLPYFDKLPVEQALASEFITQNYGTQQALWSAEAEGRSRLVVCEGLPNKRDLHELFNSHSSTLNAPENGAFYDSN
jgi:type VI secretion system protein ImpM